MNSNPKMKYWAVVGIVVVILAYLGVGISKNYINIPGITAEKPFKVIKMPEGYVTGTTKYLYKEVPPGFPKEVILENETLDHSVIVQTPGGGEMKTYIKLSYVSEKSPLEVAQMYGQALLKTKWEVKTQEITNNVSVIQLSRGDEMMIITFAPIIKNNIIKTQVTFQYEPLSNI